MDAPSQAQSIEAVMSQGDYESTGSQQELAMPEISWTF